MEIRNGHLMITAYAIVIACKRKYITKYLYSMLSANWVLTNDATGLGSILIDADCLVGQLGHFGFHLLDE